MNWFAAVAPADEDDEEYNILAAPIAEFVQVPVIPAVPCLIPSANRPERQQQLITPELKASIIPISTAALFENGRNDLSDAGT